MKIHRYTLRIHGKYIVDTLRIHWKYIDNTWKYIDIHWEYMENTLRIHWDYMKIHMKYIEYTLWIHRKFNLNTLRKQTYRRLFFYEPVMVWWTRCPACRFFAPHPHHCCYCRCLPRWDLLCPPPPNRLLR